jgi:hypothetical protein
MNVYSRKNASALPIFHIHFKGSALYTLHPPLVKQQALQQKHMANF